MISPAMVSVPATPAHATRLLAGLPSQLRGKHACTDASAKTFEIDEVCSRAQASRLHRRHSPEPEVVQFEVLAVVAVWEFHGCRNTQYLVVRYT